MLPERAALLIGIPKQRNSERRGVINPEWKEHQSSTRCCVSSLRQHKQQQQKPEVNYNPLEPVQLIPRQPTHLHRMLLNLQRNANAHRVCNHRRHISDRSSDWKKPPTHCLKPLTPQKPQPEHQERSEQEIDSGTRDSDDKAMIAAHVTGMRLKCKRSSTQQLHQSSCWSEYPPQLIRSRGGIIKFECQSAQHENQQLCAPDYLPFHTNHRRLRRIMIVASNSEPTINQINSGSLPTSVLTANSLTCNGKGNGCFTS